ncbi:ABC transporter substrate-binding protein [Blastococcus tunisiensis]|uniref:ABC-type Fe3+ transport system, substrate-binding protein n=1 Tax=Blastococcus tunisiensis TaxID=1798228 RepID=A0A1I1WLD8_9ACTN|nr:extracellular solute-binding protein [Blastococcus sp. DSM 46838]SFD95829.1 ABC-type Fe3+ transport system, substrate-binding protein [Blastococcus sp. DSM 46838]
MRRSHRTASGALAAAALILVSGCSGGGDETASGDQPTSASGDLDALVADAQAEGQLTLYGDANETSLQAWTQGFTDEYDIPVSVLRLPGSQLFQRFAQEQSAGQAQADVFCLADFASLSQAVEQQWLAEYTPENGDLLPEDLGEPGFFYPLQNSYYQTVTYNTSLLSEEEIALVQEDPIAAAGDPRFAGRIAVNMPQSSQQIAAFYYQLAEGRLADEYGWEALEAIAANDPDFLSSAELVNGVVQGEYALGVGITDSLAGPIALQGAPIEFAYPDTTVGGAFGCGVVENAPNSAAARLFMEWGTSPEAGARYSEITQTNPLNSEVEDNREITALDWYEAPDDSTTWFEFVTDEEFLGTIGPDGDFYDRWSETFGYSG